MNVKYLVGFLMGFAVAYALFGDYARYGNEVYQGLINCEYETGETCELDYQPVEFNVRLDREKTT